MPHVALRSVLQPGDKTHHFAPEITRRPQVSGRHSRTISTYRARLLEKLPLETNAQVMRYALENKLVE